VPKKWISETGPNRSRSRRQVSDIAITSTIPQREGFGPQLYEYGVSDQLDCGVNPVL
jgi:hypothetical protein